MQHVKGQSEDAIGRTGNGGDTIAESGVRSGIPGMEPEPSAEGSVPGITLAGTAAALAAESANPLTVLTKMVSACRNSKRHLVNSQKEPLHEQRAVDL
jgi:hypothetical protein